MILRKVVYILVTLVLFCSLLPFSAKASDSPFVQVVASKTNPAIGEDVTYSVNLKNFNAPSNNLSSFEVKLSFDSTYWDAGSERVNLGEYIASLSTNKYEMPINTINQANGTVHFAVSIYKNDQVTYFSGDGTLFTFTLKPKKNGATDVSISKSLFVQISKPGVNVAHGKGNASLNIGGTNPPPPPPIDPGPGSGGNPGSENPVVIPVMPAEVDRTKSTLADGTVKETVSFNGENAKKTIAQAKKSQSKAVEIKVSPTGEKEVEYVAFTTAATTISELIANNLYLIITSEKGQMELSVDTLKSLPKTENVMVSLFLQNEVALIDQTKKLISQYVKNGHTQGSSTEITTNFSGKTKVKLPLNESAMPTDAAQLAMYINTLGVFVQHSDGQVEFLKGEIQYNESKRPVAISILVDHFSTFTVVSDIYVKQTYVDEKEIQPYAYESVYKAQELAIMTGLTEEPRFGPAQVVTRAQFTKIILNMLGETPSGIDGAVAFKDVPKEYWGHGYIMKAVELGIVKGATADFFKPGATITREQMARMIGRAYKLKSNDSGSFVKFKDETSINKEALPYILVLQEKGIMAGSNGKFYPKQNVTREMAAVIAVRMVATVDKGELSVER